MFAPNLPAALFAQSDVGQNALYIHPFIAPKIGLIMDANRWRVSISNHSNSLESNQSPNEAREKIGPTKLN